MNQSIVGEASPRELLHETLTGNLGVGSLRDLALDPLRHGVRGLLVDAVPGWDGSIDRLIRTKYKPARKLTAYYQLTPGDEARHVAVTWTNESVRVLVSPDDPDLPRLAASTTAATSPTCSASPAGSTPSATDPGSATFCGFPHPTAPSTSRPTVTTPVLVPFPRWRHSPNASPGVSRRPPGRADRVLGGRPRRILGGCARRTVVAAVRRRRPRARLTFLVGRALRVLHETPLDDVPAHDGPARDASVEIASTVRAGEHIVALLPDVGAQFLAIAEDVADDLARVPTEAPTFTHGDVKSDNVLAFGNQVRLLDLDRCGPADPALDLAKFVADLRWWCGPDRRCAGGLIDSFLDGYGDADPARWERTVHLTRLFQLKLAARRCAVHDPAWETRVRARVSAAAPVLARGAR